MFEKANVRSSSVIIDLFILLSIFILLIFYKDSGIVKKKQ